MIHPRFNLGDDTGISNFFSQNGTALQIGGGIGMGNTSKLEVYRAIFNSGEVGTMVLGNAGYSLFNNSFKNVNPAVLTAFSGAAENLIYCNSFTNNLDGTGIITFGNNRNLTIHSNEFNLSNVASTDIWRYDGEIFQVQSANFDIDLPTPLNPPAGNQFSDVGQDLLISNSGNTVDYLVPQPGAGTQYYPQTSGNYNIVEAIPDIIDCPIDQNLNGSPGVVVLDAFIPNDSTGTWQDPIGDPVILDDYLDYLLGIDLGGGSDGDGHSRREIARVRYALYHWVVHMLAHPNDFDLMTIENFVDDDYRRLLVGYYIEMGDPQNADRILTQLPRIEEVNDDFVTIQEINIKRIFPSYFGLTVSYSPTSSELQAIRSIAEKFSENTGYASALYYLYTNEKVYPDPDLIISQPRAPQEGQKISKSWLQVHPNPGQDFININSNRNISECSIYDRYGRLMKNESMNSTNSTTLDISAIPVGIYFLQVKCGNELVTKKIVKI